MSKQQYYEDVKIIKKSAKKRIKNFFIFFMAVLVVGVIFFVSIHISEALTVGNIGSFLIYGDTSIKIGESTMFAVILGEYDNEADAKKVAQGSSIQGASGYVWQSNKYWVIGNIYFSQEDANKVVENLKYSNYSVVIKNITFPKIKLNFSDYENKNVKIIEKALFFFIKFNICKTFIIYDVLC